MSRKRLLDIESSGNSSNSSSSSSSSSCEIQPLKLQKFKQEVLNPKGDASRASLRELLDHMCQFNEGMRVSLLLTSQTGKEFFDANCPLRAKIAEGFGMEGFRKLPLHIDLQFFEFLDFPKTPEGKASAIIAILRAAQFVLLNSSINVHLMGIVVEEFSKLAQNHLETFLDFADDSGFFYILTTTSLYETCVKAKKVGELASLMRIAPELFLESPAHFDSSPLNEFYELIDVLGSHFSNNPEDFTTLFNGKITEKTLFYLLCSSLPMDAVNSLLHKDLISQPAPFIYNCVLKALELPLSPAVPNQDALPRRLLEFVNYAEGVSMADYYPLLRFLIKCRFEGHHLTDRGTEDLTRFVSDTSDLCSILISVGKFEEAINLLPGQVNENLAQLISETPGFSSLLAQRQPKLIRHYYSTRLHLLFQDSNVLITYCGFNTLSDLYPRIRPENMRSIGQLVFKRGTFEEIEEFLSYIDSKYLRLFYELVFEMDVEPTRSANIFTVLLSFDQPDSEMIFGGDKLLHLFSPETFVIMLEMGRVDMLKRLRSENFNTSTKNLFFKIFQRADLRSRIMPFKKQIIEAFRPDHTLHNFELFSPLEMADFVCFFNLDRVEYFNQSLKYVYRLLIQSDLNFVDYLSALMSIGRSWYTIDAGLAQYSGADYCQTTLDGIEHENVKSVCSSYYSALSYVGKNILQNIFAKIEIIKSEFAHLVVNHEN